MLLPSAAITWEAERLFGAEQRHQHDRAHALWRKFRTVVMVHLLNTRCYREGQRIPWDSGITVVTPLNRNRWNLNVEGCLSFQK
jgi:hypothetical protein